MQNNEIVLFETEDKEITLPVNISEGTVWLSRKQMAQLSNRDVKTIGKHINNALKEELNSVKNVAVAKFATTTRHGAIDNKTQIQMVEYYNLDVIISVGYRVKSQRGIEFRRGANQVLRQYILQGYAVNNKRIHQLGMAIRLMKRSARELDTEQVLEVIDRFNTALELLDDYDHQRVQRPKGVKGAYVSFVQWRGQWSSKPSMRVQGPFRASGHLKRVAILGA
ncbi:MAG: virulence RhuM family protein [Faecalicoccus sp.]|nr:virulence RhuM family protein [Faecalicoccus sp.]